MIIIFYFFVVSMFFIIFAPTKAIDMVEDIHSLSEEDIKLRYITPAILKKGWSVTDITMETKVKLTDGKINLRGNLVARGKAKFADYMLYYNRATPIAIIEAKDAEALKKYFASNVKGILDHAVHITEVKGIKTDFTIQPAKGGYKLAFGDAEFIAYFKEMLRPQLVEELF